MQEEIVFLRFFKYILLFDVGLALSNSSRKFITTVIIARRDRTTKQPLNLINLITI